MPRECDIAAPQGAETVREAAGKSRLDHWPVKMRFVPDNALFLSGANLLLAADCAAFAHGGFHEEFMNGRATICVCPKLDGESCAEKLAEILRLSDLESLTIARMSVLCCAALERAAEQAVAASGKNVPFTVVVVGTDGSATRR